MSIVFPVRCPEHPGDELTDDSTLASHHQAMHPGVPIGDFKSLLSGSSSGSSDVPAAAQTVVFRSALSKWGLLSTAFHSISPEDVSAGSELTIGIVRDALNSFGNSLQPTLLPDHAKFFLELFIAVLVNRGTDKLKGAGGFKMTGSTGGDPVFVKWETIFGFFRTYMESYGLDFVPRKLVPLCDELFWELWNDPKVVSLEDYRNRGTRASRRWTLPNGQQPKAYVLVPDLFFDHLSAEELTLRDKAQFAANIDAADVTDSAYHGLDIDHAVEARDLARQTLLSRKRRLQGGVGGPDSPSSDPILKELYPNRR